MTAVEAFVERIEAIPSVEQVRAKFAGTYLHIITYASQSTEEERYRIYDEELMLAQQWPDLQFEFDLLDRRGCSTSDYDEPGKWIKRIRRLPDGANEIQ